MRTLKKKLLSKTLGKTAYWTVNKELVKSIGLESTLILQHIIDLQDAFDEDEIFQSQPQMANELGISEYSVKNRIPELVKLGLLNVIKKGVPCKNYYSTNDDRVIQILLNGLDSTKSTDLLVDLNTKLESTDSGDEINGLDSTKSTDLLVSNQLTSDSEIVSTITNNTDKEYKQRIEDKEYITKKTSYNYSSEHDPNAFDDLILRNSVNNHLSNQELSKVNETLEYFGRK